MRDLGYTDFVARQVELMTQMIELLDVDRAVAAAVDGGLAWHEARTKCIFCSNARRCSAWLGGADLVGNPSEFCPNIAFFCDCRPRGPLLTNSCAATTSAKSVVESSVCHALGGRAASLHSLSSNAGPTHASYRARFAVAG